MASAANAAQAITASAVRSSLDIWSFVFVVHDYHDARSRSETFLESVWKADHQHTKHTAQRQFDCKVRTSCQIGGIARGALRPGLSRGGTIVDVSLTVTLSSTSCKNGNDRSERLGKKKERCDHPGDDNSIGGNEEAGRMKRVRLVTATGDYRNDPADPAPSRVRLCFRTARFSCVVEGSSCVPSSKQFFFFGVGWSFCLCEAERGQSAKGIPGAHFSPRLGGARSRPASGDNTDRE